MKSGHAATPRGHLRTALEAVLGDEVSRVRTVEYLLWARLHRGYWNDRFEVEAHPFADRHVHALRQAQPSNASRR